mmetsp:Transcript_12572/g.15816  ORF Transcript_12572/g.15816 Transcript_12572/m.15816 type:complete len:173 (+) Transcript_12572:79-597(+)|eukprot:CAMPEP_0172515616 /NCGR_PEP_ID=MMETSP1066-20121228/269408_1 /TAXON_ID=671091 /ORGANISM="Coscinodiscus wailesii, Strain CCMP2513" /LENGTH=172 /DNA_ID=CAMNT_0013296733 /DNA_START=75 /DNA_END=593 /DNA_ORIENTATION=+
MKMSISITTTILPVLMTADQVVSFDPSFKLTRTWNVPSFVMTAKAAKTTEFDALGQKQIVSQVLGDVLDLERAVECAHGDDECSLDEVASLSEALHSIEEDCIHILEHENEEQREHEIEGRNAILLSLELQHKLHLLREQMKDMPFVVSSRKLESLQEEEEWLEHYLDFYHM